jgi:DGQHR domain-containing protein
MAKLTGISELTLFAFESKNLDTICFRGDAPLAHLALISQPDIFDQVTNPSGLQRDLSTKHASEVYEYALSPKDDDYKRAFPEVVLNVRDKKVLTIEDVGVNEVTGLKAYRLRFDTKAMLSSDKVFVSRVDGNHRLYFAAGDEKREPLLVNSPFQLHVGLTRDQEGSLFVDINANQKGLQTSHLALLQHRLTEEEREIKEHLDRWITVKLTQDPDSPWHGVVGGGSTRGAKAQNLTRLVNFVTLQTGVGKTLAKSQYIKDFTNPEVQYAIVKNYWKAVKNVFSNEWSSPKEFLLLKNIGVLSMSLLGGTVIDRCLAKGRADYQDMIFYLQQAKGRFDWNSKLSPGEGTVVGMSGNKAADIVAGEMAKELHDPSGENFVRQIEAQLLSQASAQNG